MAPSYKIVVAKYNEDVKWLGKMNPANLIIYNKGSSPIPELPVSVQVINRPNLGRESETYMYYIVENYDNLPDYIIFIQGNPFDHFKKDLNINAGNLQSSIDKLMTKPPTKTTGFFLSICREFHSRNTSLCKYEYIDFIFNIKSDINNPYIFTAGCQHIVPKADILSKPIEFYRRLHFMTLNKHANLINFQSAHKNPNLLENFTYMGINPWTFERLGLLIFSKFDTNKLPYYMKAKCFLVCSSDTSADSLALQKTQCEDLLKNNNFVIYLNGVSNEPKFDKDYSKLFYHIQGSLNDESVFKYLSNVDRIYYVNKDGITIPDKLEKYSISFKKPIPIRVIS